MISNYRVPTVSVVQGIELTADGRSITWARVDINFPTDAKDRIDAALKLANGVCSWSPGWLSC